MGPHERRWRRLLTGLGTLLLALGLGFWLGSRQPDEWRAAAVLVLGACILTVPRAVAWLSPRA